MILVTGANGHLGKAVIEFLLKKGTQPSQVTGLVRDPAKAEDLGAKGIELRKGDYYDRVSLDGAFRDTDILLLVSSGSLSDRYSQHVNAIDAAVKNGVKHVVYTSALGASMETRFKPSVDHFKTEEYLIKSGLSYTVFRNAFYYEVLPMMWADAMTSGNWFYPAGNAKANFAARLDMAEAIANVLSVPGEHAGKIYEITSSESKNFQELADTVGKFAGRKIQYTPISLADFEDGIRKAGVPEAYIPLMVSIADALGAGEMDVTDNSLEKILKRKPAALGDYLPGMLGK